MTIAVIVVVAAVAAAAVAAAVESWAVVVADVADHRRRVRLALRNLRA